MSKEVKTFLILKYGSIEDAYELWMHYFDDTSFTQEESDLIAKYAKDNNMPTGAYTYDYTNG